MQLRVIEAGDRGAPVVVLAHGFPELAYSWRHQIPALAEAGYHVLAPDQRGYGGSSKPEAVDAYNVVELSADIVGLLDDVGAERAVIVGHDFGGVVAWTAPLLHPDRFAGGRRAERAAGAAAAGADDAGVPQGCSATTSSTSSTSRNPVRPTPNSTATRPPRCAS